MGGMVQNNPTDCDLLGRRGANVPQPITLTPNRYHRQLDSDRIPALNIDDGLVATTAQPAPVGNNGQTIAKQPSKAMPVHRRDSPTCNNDRPLPRP